MRKKYLLITIFITVLIIIGVIVAILVLLNREEKNVNMKQYKNLEEAFQDANKVEEINKKMDYFEVKECLNKYVDYARDESSKRILSVFSDDVKDELGLSEDNVKQKINLLYQIKIINVIYQSLQTVNKIAFEEQTDIEAFIVKGRANENEDFTLIVMMDKNDRTFNIIPKEYIEVKKINISKGNGLEIYKEDKIENNLYNTFKYSTESEEKMGIEYFNMFITELKEDSKVAYEMLEEEYKKENYNSYEAFEKYIDNNKEEINKMVCTKCTVEYKNNTIEYNCVEGNSNNNFIFTRKENIFDFSVRIEEL